jgi:N4-gp56 family major capsid protein
MAQTNFALLTSPEKVVWSRDVWMAARNASFAMQFMGKGPNAMIQRITELTKSEKGTKAIINLVTDLEGDGIRGDDDLEGNEEEIKAQSIEIVVDQLRNANRTTGRLADQKSVIGFRNTSKDVLAYWLADRIDQLGFQTLAGWNYNLMPDGRTRVSIDAANTTFANLDYQAEAPTDGRHLTWKGTDAITGGFETAGATNIDMANPSWNMIVELKAYAKDNYVRGVKGPNNTEFYHLFMTPQGLAKLKQDQEFKKNLESGYNRGSSNPLFSGSVITSDGVIVHEFRHVPNTSGLAMGSKWGTAGNTQGQAALFCGAQALGFADLGLPYWDEDKFDYKNQQGIAVGKIFGYKKPAFNSIYSGTDEDFGVIRINTAVDLAAGY